MVKSWQVAEHDIRLLEVGALKPDNYKACTSWIDATPIDLHSRHPSILEQDFLLLDETENYEKWDCISLSLVLNFVPDARVRGIPYPRFARLPSDVVSGNMLRLAHSMLSVDGHLFLAVSLIKLSKREYYRNLRHGGHSSRFLALPTPDI